MGAGLAGAGELFKKLAGQLLVETESGRGSIWKMHWRRWGILSKALEWPPDVHCSCWKTNLFCDLVNRIPENTPAVVYRQSCHVCT